MESIKNNVKKKPLIYKKQQKQSLIATMLLIMEISVRYNPI